VKLLASPIGRGCTVLNLPSDSTSPRRRGRPDELRARTIDAAVDLLLEEGGPGGFANTKLEDAIVRSGVPRASAYRAWSGQSVDLPGDKPQARFEVGVGRELLKRAERAGNELLDKTIASLEGILPAMAEPEFSRSSPEERAELILELFRVAGNVAYREFSTDPIWQFHLEAIVGSEPGPDRSSSDRSGADPTVEAGHADRLADRFDGPIIERFLGFITELSTVFGARIQPGMRLELFGFTAAALMKGMGMQSGGEPVPHPTTGAGNRWSPFSLALLGLYRVYFENDPDNGPDCVIPHRVHEPLT
jgi:AcrR family transcriptional regulator